MGAVHGMLGVPDSDDGFLDTYGQAVVYDAVQEVLAQRKAEVETSLALFSQGTTTLHAERYYLGGGGYLDEVAENSTPSLVKAGGSWDVGYPIKEYANGWGASRKALARMRLKEFDKSVSSLWTRAMNTLRREVLRPLFINADRSFRDDHWPVITVKPLANGTAGELYPPVSGSDTEATANHYIVAGYVASAIDPTHNPYPLGRQAIEQHYGGQQAEGSYIIAFINSAQEALTKALVDFEKPKDFRISLGANSDQLISGPEGLPAGSRYSGRTDGVDVVVWDTAIPAGYILFVDPSQDAPLKQRVSDAPGLSSPSLELVGSDDRYPLQASFYSLYTGFGVANRLNGAVVQLKASGNYDIPAKYAV